MHGTWSLSTTLRNPERIRDFLIVLSRFEGKDFNEEVQALYFKELIKSKKYMPNDISDYYKKKYEEVEEFTAAELEDILSQIYYTNGTLNDDQEQIYALRGRTAVSSIVKMGLAISKESMGVVRITDLGKRLITEEVEMTEVFFRYFLKWQLPSPTENGYKNFDIIPFIAVMHVIDKVKKKWRKMGKPHRSLSKEEFALFLTSLTHYKDIDNTVEQIIEFRTEKCFLLKKGNEAQIYVKKRFEEKVIEVFNLDPTDFKTIVKKVNNLYDYADSAIRYFRQTDFLSYRRNRYHIDFSYTRLVEIKRLLQNFDGSSIPFSDVDSYLGYMSNINQPDLPWENLNDLKEGYKRLLKRAEQIQNSLSKWYQGQTLHTFTLVDQQFYTIEEYKIEIKRLKDVIKTLQNDAVILAEKNLQNIDKYILTLSALANRKRSLSGQDPLHLEHYVALSLMALGDAKEIRPNYPVGDDNMPLFTAAGNKPDIECFYSSFNMICEVTLLRGRDQWFNEGQPVMRHLRDFETKNDIEAMENYCLFIAPHIHRDTLNTFWMSVKMGYEGKTQKIVPLTITQYVNILKRAKELNECGKRVNHKDFKNLLAEIFDNHQFAGNDSTVWLTNVDSVIERWGT